MIEHLLWVEKYRPRRVADTILPSELKSTFQTFVDSRNIPNLILAGPPGVGKTTVARAMCDEIEADYIVINGSLDGNIDTLRTTIMQFASSVSLTGERKYVILDEADYLTQFTQPALRNFIEEFSKNCGFILTCNYVDRLIKPLHSRCAVVDFTISKKEAAGLAAKFFSRVMTILEGENVEYDRATVAELVQKHFPDWRRVLNELQRYSATGKIDSGILSISSSVSIRDLLDLMKDKNYTGMRRWVSAHSEIDSKTMFRDFYDQASESFTPDSVPVLILLLGKYQYQAAFVADPEINLMAFLTEVMVDCEVK